MPRLVPSDKYPMPFGLEDDEVDTFVDEVAVAGNTAEMLKRLGAVPELCDITGEKELLDSVIKDRETENLSNLSTALGASEFLREYGRNLALDVTQIRHALTNKLLELSNCGKPQYELRAIELLGKHSDIGLFTERSEININFKSPEELETAIKDRIKRLLNTDVLDMVPLAQELDDELAMIPLLEKPEEESAEETSDA